MKKATWFWIIGILIIIIIISYLFVFPLLHSTYEIKVYKDGKVVCGRSSDGAMCDIIVGLDACQSFGFKEYNFVVNPQDKVTGVSSSKCSEEFKKQLGQELKGFCTMEIVMSGMDGFIN